MMAQTYSLLTLILCLVTGGGNDLLDYLPTEAFWKEKAVEVSLETMTAALADKPGEDVTTSIGELGSADAETRDNAAMKILEVGGTSAYKPLQAAAESPDGEVRRRARQLLRQLGGDEVERGIRRLMAIRTLGELGKFEALPSLKPLLESKELFVADYAEGAIAQIEGRSLVRNARPVAPDVADDVWMLPKECQTIGQIVPRRGSPLGFAEFMAAIKGADDADKEESAAMVTRTVLSLAERIGNVRIDAATFGVVGMPVELRGTDSAGYLAIVVRGRYNAERVRALAKSDHVLSQDVDGVEVFQPDEQQAWIVPSNEVFVFLAAPVAENLPLKTMAASVKAGRGSLASDEVARKLVQSVDTRQVMWAVSTVSESQRLLPVAEAFQTISLVGTRSGKTLTLTLTGRGSDPARVKDAAEKVNKHAKDSADFLAGMQVAPVIKMAVQLLRSFSATADGTTATLTAKLETTPAAILSLPWVHDEDPEVEQVPANPRLRRKQPE